MANIPVPSYRKRLSYHATLLGGMGLLASAVLVMTNIATDSDIKLRVKEDMQASLEQVIPASLHDNDLFDDNITVSTAGTTHADLKVYRARQQHRIIAVAFETTGIGYSGPIELIMGIDSDGKLLGVRVVSHSETPGLGDKIEVKKTDWITKFTGLSLGDPAPDKWKVKKDGGVFDQFSGATITPRAVVNAIRNGLMFFAEHRQQLFSDPPVVSKAAPTTQDVLLGKKFASMSASELLALINQ